MHDTHHLIFNILIQKCRTPQPFLKSKYQGSYWLTSTEIQYTLSPFISKIEYNFEDPKSRRKFQSDLIRKAKKINEIAKMNEKDTQIFTFQQFTTIFKVVNHLQVYLIFDNEENSILMENVINCLFDVMKMITTDPYQGKNIFAHLEDVILAIDQIVDQGIFVTLDPQVVFSRLKMREGVDGSQSPTKKAPPAAQQSGGGGFSSLFGFAKNSLQKTLNMG